MAALGNNVAVFDIELLRAEKDKEFDRGYYDDVTLTGEEVGKWWNHEL